MINWDALFRIAVSAGILSKSSISIKSDCGIESDRPMIILGVNHKTTEPTSPHGLSDLTLPS